MACIKCAIGARLEEERAAVAKLADGEYECHDCWTAYVVHGGKVVKMVDIRAESGTDEFGFDEDKQ